MAHLPVLAQHEISFVRTLREGGAAEERGHVYCARRAATLPIGECARCAHFIKVTPGTHPNEAAVHCRPATSPAPEGSDEAEYITLRRMRVSGLMTRNVVCVRPELSLDAVSALFLESGLKAVPVVDAEGHLLGFISEAEVMLAVHVTRARGTPELPATVADVLLPFALALPESASVTQAAAVMAFEGQQRVAIVSPSGSLVGVLSASDVMYWLARSDGHTLPKQEGLR